MSLSNTISQLRSANQAVPLPLKLPSEDEVSVFEEKLDKPLHPDFRRYLLEASDIVFGTKEPITITNPKSHTYFWSVLDSAKSYGLPQDLVPICEDNADFFCITESGEIVFWSHNGWSDESWPSLESWIQEVWLGAA